MRVKKDFDVDNQTLIILAVCGFLTVIVSVGILGLMTVFRFTGRNFMGFLGFLARDSKQVQDEGDERVSLSRRPDLRTIADQSDFDAALAKHIVTDQPQRQPAAYAANAAPPSAPFAPANASPYNQPFAGTPKPPTILPGTIPGSNQAPPPVVYPTQNAPAAQPSPAVIQPITPTSLGWDDPALPPRDFDKYSRARDRDDEDDLLGGLIGSGNGDDGGVLG